MARTAKKTTKRKAVTRKKTTRKPATRKPAARKKTTRKKATRKPATRKATTRKATTRKKTVAKKAPAKKKSTVKKSTATGGSMAKRKSSKKKTSTVSRARRAAGSFVRSSNAVGMLKQSGLAIAGGVGAGMLANKVPIADKRIKSALPIVAGIVLNGTLGKRNKMIQGIAEGMVILGSVSLFKSLAPNVPMLAGDDPQYFIPTGIPYTPPEMIPDQSAAVAGEMVNLGERVDMGIDEYYSPADI